MTEERIGDKLRRLRQEVGLSQRKLAKQSGVDREYICQIEANKTKSITLRTAEKLARGLGISPCRFFNGDSDQITKQALDGVIDYIKGLK